MNNGYAAEASTENDGTSTGQGYRVFDGVRLERGHHGTTGTYSSGTYQSNKSIIDVNNKIHSGEWIKLQMPTTEKMQLRGFTFHPRNATYGPYRIPLEGVFLGSTDGNNWYPIHYFYNFAVTGGSIVSSTKYFEPTNHVYYNHIAFVAYKLQNHSSGSVLNFAELDLFGTPEYDPEAHGTDVTVKSYPNVPNTDWLERYYDAKNYSSGSTILDELTATHRDATINGSVPLDTSSGINSWSFNGNTSNFISGDDNVDGIPPGGDWVHSMSIWFKTTDMSNDQNIAMILPSANLNGSSPASGSASAFYLRGKNSGTSPNHLQIVHWSQDVRINYIFNEDEWYHLTYAYSGGGVSSASQHTYINGVHVPLLESTRSSSTAGDPLNTSSVSRVVLGKRYLTGNEKPFTGSIANFRLFNRALTSDEIYQLYAYQKEYFGHGDLSMTLKAGRLGIGTSEPRAALDVRGRYIRSRVRQSRSKVCETRQTRSGSATECPA